MTALQTLLLEIQQEDFLLIINAISDNKRQQTTAVDYKRLINGLVLTGFAILQRTIL